MVASKMIIQNQYLKMKVEPADALVPIFSFFLFQFR
jgi:hypothetical protein